MGTIDRKALAETGRLIAAKCAEFGVEGEVTEYHPGPVVTTYEFRPAAGIKVNQVMGLSEDLALALSAESIRVERLPGRASVGIEVPNPGGGEIIAIRDVVESERFQGSRSPLTLALGKDIHGEPVVDDLRGMPHLLIAGTTGSGKSVGINSLITSILYKAPPDKVKLILIDPKMVELEMYENLPHLATPIITDPKKAANALKWAVAQMEERFQTLSDFGQVRNAEQYNAAIKDPEAVARVRAQHPEDPDLKLEPMPLIVVIIDELADLMMTAPKDVEESIVRIAQKARAVGIHLVVATQRPSVDVLTGVIKANLPSRIAFKVSSKIDSRVILDGNGAERLLGRGDMLFLPPGTSRLKRVHGAYVSVQETAALVKFLRKQAKPQFDEEITKDRSEAVARDDAGDETDPLYDEAARLVVREKMASISFLQRRMGVGLLARRQAHRHDVPRRAARAAAGLEAPGGPGLGRLLRGSGPTAAMTRAMRSLVLAFVAAPFIVYGVYRLARGLGFLDPPWNPEHEERRTIVAALYAFLLFLCIFLFGYANAWPRVWAIFGIVNAVALVLFLAIGAGAARRLWRLRHPLPEASPAAPEPPDGGADPAARKPLS